MTFKEELIIAALKIIPYDRYDLMADAAVKIANHVINMLPQDVPEAPREFWLIAGRYFESEHDARMWAISEFPKMCDDFGQLIIHAQEKP